MRYFAILVTCVLWSATAVAQTQTPSESYPWRSVLNQTQQSNVSTAVGSSVIPRPPVMESNPIFPKTQDTQKSPSDIPVEALMNKQGADQQAQDYNFNNVPATAGSNEYYDQSGAQQPQLSLQSGGVSECCDCGNNCETGICFCPPKRLIKKPLFGAIDVYGFAQFGYHDVDSILFNTRPDAFNAHQVWLTLDEPAGRHTPIGMRIDAVYGLDAQFMQARGNSPLGAPDDWDNSYDNGSFGWAIPQAYLSWGNETSQFRAGKFLSPFGYEQLPSIENFFYSRTYTRVYTEPASHTGAMVEIKRSPTTSVIGGVTFGWDSGFEHVAGGFNVLTGLRTQLNQDVKISLTSSLGDTGLRGTGTLNSLVAELRLLPRLNYILQGDSLNLGTNQEFGITQYMLYNVNNRLAVGGRLEWWKSDQLTPTTRSTYDLTFGSNYRVNSNILIRPEVRWDWGANAVDPGNTMVGIDAIIAF